MSNRPNPRKNHDEARAHEAYIAVFQRRVSFLLWHRGLVRCQDDCDDVVGYASEWLFRNFAKLYGRYANAATLASVVARHRAIEWFRRESRQAGAHILDENGIPLPCIRLDQEVNPHGDDDDDRDTIGDLLEGGRDIADIHLDAEEAIRLEQALVGILSPKLREVFFPVRLDGRRVKDVAKDLGIEANAATQRLRQAERTLKRIIENEPWRLFGR